MIEQTIQRVLECARQQLAGEIDGQEAGIRVYCFVASHRILVFENSDGVILPSEATQGKMRVDFFYTFVRQQQIKVLHMTKNTDYELISEIAQTDSKEKVNAYLKLNWILLNIESRQYSEHGWTTSFILGWTKSNGVVKHPEKTELEKILESAKNDDSIPF